MGHSGRRKKISKASWCGEWNGRFLSRLSLRHVVICGQKGLGKRHSKHSRMQLVIKENLEPGVSFQLEWSFSPKIHIYIPSHLASQIPKVGDEHYPHSIAMKHEGGQEEITCVRITLDQQGILNKEFRTGSPPNNKYYILPPHFF